jgi:hypothetical protein
MMLGALALAGGIVAVQRDPALVYRLPSSRLRHAVFAILGRIVPASSGLSRQLPPPPATVIGMNAPDIRYYSSSVPFANLVMGADWLDSHWQPLAEAHQNANGDIRSLPVDGVALRFLSVPATGPAGTQVRCTFSGSGTLSLAGGGETIASAPNQLLIRLTNPRGRPAWPWLVLKQVDPRRPLRDLDCREAQIPRAARFRPAFLATLRGYGVIRFMDWQNANANQPVTWRTRHTPAGNRLDRDGVAIEDMLALVRELGAAPWFVMPWNADAAYIAGFARMVRAQLPPGRSVYVEVGNEVWNTGFPVGRQAVAEGIARHLGGNDREAGMRRYAERTVEVMRPWEAAFAGRGGLVRVLATQHVLPETAEIAIGYRDTAAHVDAIATAPYFGTTLGGTANTRASSLAALEAILPEAIRQAVDNRRVAVRHGKRYIAYEGGQSLVLPAQLDLTERLQHDPAMYDLYRRYLAMWRRTIGDTLCLLTSVAPTGPSGAWGLATREDETPAQAPKLRAVREALQHR